MQNVPVNATAALTPLAMFVWSVYSIQCCEEVIMHTVALPTTLQTTRPYENYALVKPVNFWPRVPL